MTTAPEPSSKNFSAYVMTHCTTCRAGWIRKGENGAMAITCLIDREAVWSAMTECSHFEPESSTGS